MTQEVLQHQAELEQQMIQRGQERYNRRQEKLTPSQREIPHQILTDALPKVSQAITIALDEDLKRFSSGLGKKSLWYEELIDQDPDTLAYLGLNCCYDGVLKLSTLAGVLTQIGARVELEVWAEDLKQYDNNLFKRLVSQVARDHSSERYRLKAARIIASKAGFKFDKWSRAMKINIASPILNAVLEHSGIFDVSTEENKLKTHRFICLTSEAEDLLKQKLFDASWAEPQFGPLVIPPKPWTAYDTGVYQDDMLSPLVPLVRKATGEQRRAIENDLKGTQEPLYVKAINALQATPLRINKRVLGVLEYCVEEKLRFGKFPELEPPEFPKLPGDFERLPEKTQRQLKRDQKDWHVKRRESVANQVVMYDDLRHARLMSDYEQFWIGWSFDFRSRMYPVSHFNYHRDDHVKALFEFARGKPVAEEDKGWLAIHLANTGDFQKISKKSLDDRIQWVLDNDEWLRLVNDSPETTVNLWTEADKPFQFLAAVFAYYSDDPVCHLPISLDGTNSGVQHYALALRSAEDGHMVNLLPDDECQDVYQTVADQVIQDLTEDGSDEAKKWLEFGINRSTVKRNVMTYGYSSVERGFGDQIIEDLMQPLQKDVNYGTIVEHPFGDYREQETYARFLAKFNYQAVQKVISSVAQGMAFLQSYADALARESRSVRWTTPSGFPAIQRYTKPDVKRVKIFLYDREAKLRKQTRVTLHGYGPKYDTRKARAGVAPNFVHSLDAAHMQLAICHGLDKGIEDFFMIHDSFGTNAADTWTFYHNIRHAVVDMYEDNCVLGNFEVECRNRLANPDMELAQVPTKGTLDVRAVLDSEYCFS
jgi:DNA-directed RNA polymerase